MEIIKTYSDLIKLDTFEKRFEYLKLEDKNIGEDTFGYKRYLNQIFYKTPEWKRLRDYIIVRDNGCDLGIFGYELSKENIIVHHINPITSDDILYKNLDIFNPEFLITTCLLTHNFIHYGKQDIKKFKQVERIPNDTCLWKTDRGK